jgi:two-component system alkaline phosphatase synthesis response regulator PhoP
MTHRILVVDDDPQIVRLARSYLEQAGYSVLMASDGEGALHAIRADRPDLVVLDLMLPNRSGQDITRIIRGDASLAQLPIIMLTARVEDADRIAGLELGADDYVTKPFNPRELVARVQAVLRRASGQVSTSPVLRDGGIALDADRHEVSVDGAAVELTPTEYELLQVLMKSPGHAFTRLELVERAMGYSYAGMERTLDSHIKNLRKKLEPDPANPTHIETVYGIGYRWATRSTR